MGIKRDKYDAVVSDLVREMADYTCEHCGANFRHNTGVFDCSHYVGRRHAATRYDLDNLVGLCRGCHNYFGERPNDHMRMFIKIRGEGLEGLVHEKAHQIKKWKKWEKEEMYQYYKAELKRLEQLRADGVTGPIEIANYC